MIQKTYLFFRNIILLFITLLAIIGFLLTTEKLLPFLAEKYLKEFGVEYSKVQGSLFGGVSVYDLKYGDSVTIEKVEVNYNFLMLFTHVPIFSDINVEGLSLNLDKLLSSDINKIPILPFTLSKLKLKNVELIVGSNSYYFDLETQEVRYNNGFDAQKVALSLKSSFANIVIKEGEISSNALKGDATLELSSNFLKEYLAVFKGVPKFLDVKLDATLQRINATTKGLDLRVKSDENLSIKHGDLNLTYFIEDGYFSANATYLLSYGEYEAMLNQSALFDENGAFYTKLDAKLKKHPITLPFENFSAEAAGDTQSMVANMDTQKLKLNFLSKDYKNFLIHAKGEKLSLSFLENLPEIFKKNVLSFEGDAILKTSPLSLSGTVQSEGLYGKEKIVFEMDKKSSLYQVEMSPKPKSELFKSYNMKQFSQISLVLYDDYESQILNIDTNLLHATLQKKGEALSGGGNFSSSNFTISGNLSKDGDANIKLSAKLPSLKRVLHDFNLGSENDHRFYDGEVNFDVTMHFADKISVNGNIYMPWNIIKLDSETTYGVKDIFVKLSSVDREITIDSYRFEFMNHKVYSKKPSKLLFDMNDNIHFKEFWIYDNLLLSGILNPADMRGNLNLKSEKFMYEGNEGNVTLKGEIRADFDADKAQRIEGNLTLLDGLITYVPQSDYAVLDSDIIVIQEMKNRKKHNRFVNIHIDSSQPIRYKAREIDLLFTPDIMLFEEPKSELKVLGMVTIHEGKVTGGDKTFEFDKSEIYFYGATPINPYLNLNMHYYTLDYIDIEIYVTNTLNAPVLIF
ncbi:MAG: translocation/assembly module TamB domain-containing protein, partial [Sulfurimonas sp.]|nr:translocation/assembly module TamB domain-containing protein [Sulfurimonas sp.]